MNLCAPGSCATIRTTASTRSMSTPYPRVPPACFIIFLLPNQLSTILTHMFWQVAQKIQLQPRWRKLWLWRGLIPMEMKNQMNQEPKLSEPCLIRWSPFQRIKKIVETAVMKMKRGVGRTKEEEGVKEVMEGEAVEAKVTPRQGQLSLAWSPFLCTFIALNKFTQTILTGRSCQKVETRDGQSHQSVWPSSISFLTRLKFHACSCRGSRHLQPELEIPAMLCMHFQEMRWEPWLAQPSAELSNTLPDKWKLDHLRWLYL